MTLVTDLTESTTPTLDALAYIVDDPNGSPADRKITIVNLLKGAGGRERLEANRIYYVRTDGSDSNTGLVDSAGGAFLTIQKALTTVASDINLNGFDVTIQVRDGTYLGDITLDSPFDGDGTVTLVGNIATPANVIIQAVGGAAPFYGHGLLVTNGARLVVNSVHFQRVMALSYGVEASAYGYIDLSQCVFSTTGSYTGANIHAHEFGYIEITGDITVQSGTYGSPHLFADYFGHIGGLQYTTTLTGVPSLTFFANARRNSMIQTGTFIGTFTGTRWNATEKSLVLTSIPTLTAIPGSVAGNTDEDSTYNDQNEYYYVRTSDFNKTDTTPSVALGATLLAGGYYEFTARLFTTSNVAAGVKAGVTYTAGVTAIVYDTFIYSGTSISAHARATASGTYTGVTAVTDAFIEIKGFVQPSVTGSFSVLFAQNVVNAAPSTAMLGSTLHVVRID